MVRVNRGYGIYWLLWIGVGFGIPELLAWINPQSGDTLSEGAWWLVEHRWGTWLVTLGFAALLFHFLKGHANWFGKEN